ncbi:class I SAM-dependent methyltransferase [Actinoplanes hulinensis]|uniref:Class I SAM-dependent methyltransferase n=1 Tax=Actinoplanes hulinensis TaxID=1144547 RepID=A0ABS7AUV0_9ACTN|nr:class I SAM-dependent methyltransferase [Actinoplanes hulinensis]MBW6432550.1 class I SAM-dependent methyltransferase [Actinoplanes hulinensis]
MTSDYTGVFQDTEAVEKYETVTYAPDSYASRINDRQRDYLRALVRREFPEHPPVQHDFACGTGRAVRALHGLVREAHGYDTSAEMMSKAAEVGSRAYWHLVPQEGPVPQPVAAGFPAIVTIFRLLLNVDEGVRDRALAFAAKVLPHRGSGLLVVENHGNAGSVRHLRARRHSGERWFAELSHDEVGRLLARHGFEIVERRGFSMLTPSLHDHRVARLADAAARRMPGSDAYAVNVLYTARRLHA